MKLNKKLLFPGRTLATILISVVVDSGALFAQNPAPAPTPAPAPAPTPTPAAPKAGGTDAGGGSLPKSFSYWKEWNDGAIEILEKHKNWAEVAGDNSNFSDGFKDLCEGLVLAESLENQNETRTFLRKSLGWGLKIVEILSDPLIKTSDETRFDILNRFYKFLLKEVSEFDSDCWFLVGTAEEIDENQIKSLYSHVISLVEAHLNWIVSPYFVGTNNKGEKYPRVDDLLFRKVLAGHLKNMSSELLRGGYLFRFQAQDIGRKLDGIAVDLEEHNNSNNKPFGGNSKVAFERSVDRIQAVLTQIQDQKNRDKNLYPNGRSEK